MLAAISCFFNPAGYKQPAHNFLRFQKSLEGVDLFTIEASFTDQFVIPNATIQIRCNEENLMWQKERLLNLLLEQLPSKYDNVAWLDGDVLFMNPQWAEKTEQKLKEHPIVQLFSTGHYMDANGQIAMSGASHVRQHQKSKRSRKLGLTGFAWAARRELLEDGFYDSHIVGAGDHLMILGWTGTTHPRGSQVHTPDERSVWNAWSEKAYSQIQGNLGYIEGDLVHMFHGSLRNRAYLKRHQVLIKNRFDPNRDIELGENGLWRFASDKPFLRDGIRRYFNVRREDQAD